jgi:transcriptional regulator with XRE-family HTH domain
MSIPSNVKRLMDAQGLSEADLAHSSLTSPLNIARLLAGDKVPKHVLYKVAEALGSTVDKLEAAPKVPKLDAEGKRVIGLPYQRKVTTQSV